MRPVHGIPSTHKIIVQFPTTGNTIQLQAGVCQVSQTVNLIASAATCSIDSTHNSVVLTNAFGTGSFPKGGAAFTYLFSSGGVNPRKTCGSILFTASTFATIGGVDYPIDYYAFDSSIDLPPRFQPFQPVPPLLSA